MKKLLLLISMMILFVSPFVAATTMMTSEKVHSKITMQRTTTEFTHTVFIEEATTTWCPNCPLAAETLNSLYKDSGYPFYYVALVSDINSIASNRFWGHYRGLAIPTIFVDGGFDQLVGDTMKYRSSIEAAGARTVHPLELTTNVVGHDDATLDVTVTVKNTGSTKYLGYVRSYVTEIISRWINEDGDPYHFGFLDYAVKSFIFLAPQESRTFTMTWDGAATHGDLTFPDIVDDNIMVITAVASWQPHLVLKEEYIGTHFAFYADQTAGALVE